MDFVRGAGGTPPVATVRLIGTVGCVHPLLPPSYNSVGGGAGRRPPCLCGRGATELRGWRQRGLQGACGPS
jgi:hypothetical protein